MGQALLSRSRAVLTGEASAESVHAKKVYAKKIGAKYIDAKDIDAHKVDARKVSAKHVEAKKVNAHEVNAKHVDAKEVGADRVYVRKDLNVGPKADVDMGGTAFGTSECQWTHMMRRTRLT